jgi:hypothetical protein
MLLPSMALCTLTWSAVSAAEPDRRAENCAECSSDCTFGAARGATRIQFRLRDQED